jgi:hypothetical protein
MTWKAKPPMFCGYCGTDVAARGRHSVSCAMGRCLRCQRAPMVGGGLHFCAPCDAEIRRERAAVVAEKLAELDNGES